MWVTPVVEVVVEITDISTEIVVFIHAVIWIVVITFCVDLDAIFRSCIESTLLVATRILLLKWLR